MFVRINWLMNKRADGVWLWLMLHQVTDYGEQEDVPSRMKYGQVNKCYGCIVSWHSQTSKPFLYVLSHTHKHTQTLNSFQIYMGSLPGVSLLYYANFCSLISGFNYLIYFFCSHYITECLLMLFDPPYIIRKHREWNKAHAHIRFHLSCPISTYNYLIHCSAFQSHL